MNQSQLLANKYKLPEYTDITIESRSAMLEGEWQRTYLDRNIAALMLKATELDFDITHLPDFDYGYCIWNKKGMIGSAKFIDHPTKLDALCEALCQALLAE